MIEHEYFCHFEYFEETHPMSCDLFVDHKYHNLFLFSCSMKLVTMATMRL